MDPSFLRYYNNELQHLREVGGEFAKEFPKIAGRLGLDEFECADPYVERLLEGFAFMAARLQLKIDREFPKFTQHLQEIVYPHYLSPTPSMAIVQFQPELSESSLADGFEIARGSRLRGAVSGGEQTACEFQTRRAVDLWPIKLVDARYLASHGDVAATKAQPPKGTQAGLRLSFELTAGVKTNELALDQLELFLRGSGEVVIRLIEQIHGCNAGYGVLLKEGRQVHCHNVSTDQILMPGFSTDESILPYDTRSFQGYRLLQEYLTSPQNFDFVRLLGLNSALHSAECQQFDLVIYFNQTDPQLVNAVETANVNLFCCPAINLFDKTCDRIHVTHRDAELHVVPDRTRPMDFEVHSIQSIRGFGEDLQRDFSFKPFYWSNDRVNRYEEQAYYTQRRHRRALSSRQLNRGPRSSYIGSELYVMPCDANEAPFPHELKQLAVSALCTNRDLPILMPVGSGDTDFTLLSGAPVKSVRCVIGPTEPRPSFAEGETSWRLISHLSLNYLSLFDPSAQDSAASLREMLELYIDRKDPSARQLVSGLIKVRSERIVRRLPMAGPITAGRGLEITLTFDETKYEGSSVFVFGRILEEFMAKFVSINSFTETVIETNQRGKIMRWPLRIGRRPTI